MAVAAYATLQSLSRVLNNLLHPARLRRLHVDTNQIQSLQEKVQFLLDFLEAHSQRISEEIGGLGRQIADAAAEAEEVVDRHVVDQLRERSQEESHRMTALSSFCHHIDTVIGKIDSLTKELTMLVKEEWADIQEEQRAIYVPVESQEVLLSCGKKSTMMGFDEHLERIVDKLTRDEPNLQILSIVGMGGIGKTTLAQNAFDHPYIVHYFPKRIWLTISQQYSVRDILLRFLKNGDENNECLAELGQRLYQNLFGERYLIVMDDVWSIKAWNALKLFFPNNAKGSRVMVTTRESNLAISLGSHESYSIDFLNEDKSWNLFCHKAFSQEGCPYSDLEEIGKNIARSCHGLPLTITVIGGLLAKSNMTREYWESIAENVSTFRNSKDYERCLNILSLSYNNLPIHLKPCLLYMIIFPEDANIRVSKLTKLWIAEGFLKPINGQSLDEVAEIYLRYLIDRNLILSLKFGYDGNIETCGIHDLVRDTCLREYEKEHFRYAPKVLVLYLDSSWMYHGPCFFCGLGKALRRIDLNEVHDASQLTSLARVLVCNICKSMYSSLTRARLVRVRLVQRNFLGRDPKYHEILLPTSLRYLEVRISRRLEFSSPTPIALLWNQETFVFHSIGITTSTVLLPPEIWDMPQLRHILGSCNVVLPDQAVTQDSVIMKNLHTLTKVRDFKYTKEVRERMPNLKKFDITLSRQTRSMERLDHSLHNLVHLHKLEALYIKCEDLLLENLTFPTSLKKLILSGCNIPWENMMTIGSLLPNLQVLELFSDAFKGPEWNQDEGEFSRLKVLRISNDHHLERWRAEDIHFPSLEHLILTGMAKLTEIPSCIGDIPTLGSIDLKCCHDSVIELAKQIVEEQHDNGNESLQLYINQERYHIGSL